MSGSSYKDRYEVRWKYTRQLVGMFFDEREAKEASHVAAIDNQGHKFIVINCDSTVYAFRIRPDYSPRKENRTT